MGECNKRDDDYDGVKTWLTSLVIIKWTTRISWLTRMPPSWLMLKLLKEHHVQLNNSILVHLRITSVKTCLLHTKWPALCRPFSGQVDPDCQALHGLCHRDGQHLALVAFHYFWTHRLHAGHISVPTHQKVLVNLIHLSPGKALLLLEIHTTLLSASRTKKH